MPLAPARLGLLVATLSLFGGCAEPVQNGGVVIFGGIDQRISAMCRFRRDAEGKEGFCAPEEQGPRPTDVTQTASGDLKLDNGEIAVVVGGQKSRSFGGIVEAGFAEAKESDLESLTTCFGAPLGCLVTSELSQGKASDGSAWVIARGKAQSDGRISVATRYVLAPGSRMVVVTSKLTSAAEEPITITALGDLARFRAGELYTDGAEPAPNEAQKGAYFASFGEHLGYAIAPPAERSALFVARTAEGSMVYQGEPGVLSSDKPLVFERLFGVVPRGDTLAVRTELALAREGQAPGAMAVELVDAEGHPIALPTGARLRLLSTSASSPKAEVGWWKLGADASEPVFSAEAPPGRYALDLAAKGLVLAAPASVDVRSGEVAKVSLSVTRVKDPESVPQASP